MFFVGSFTAVIGRNSFVREELANNFSIFTSC